MLSPRAARATDTGAPSQVAEPREDLTPTQAVTIPRPSSSSASATEDASSRLEVVTREQSHSVPSIYELPHFIESLAATHAPGATSS